MNWIRFIFGACWASFITTIVWRHWLNHDRPYPPYSQCENCGRRLRAWQLVPVIGWLLQGEEMPLGRWLGFGLVWLALSVFVFDQFRQARLRSSHRPKAERRSTDARKSPAS